MPASASPATTLNATDPLEEIGTPPNQEIPSNLLGDQQHLAHRSGCAASQKQGESIFTSNAASKLVNHELDMSGELDDQVVQNLLSYFKSDNEQPYLDDFPQNISPMQSMQTCKDSPVVSEMQRELCRELFPNDIAEQESNKLIGTMFNGQEGESSQVLCTQRQGQEANLERSHQQSLTPKDTSPEAHCRLHPQEIVTPEAPAFADMPLRNVVENEDYFFNFYQMEQECPSLAFDALEIESTMIITTQQGELGIPAEQSSNQDYFIDHKAGLGSIASTGIRINPRPPMPLPESSYSTAQQGTTSRRLRLETTPTRRNSGVRQHQSTGIRINPQSPMQMPESSYSTAQQGTTLRRLRLETTPTRMNSGVRQYPPSRSISRPGSFVGVTRANLKWLMFIVLLMSGFVFCWYVSSVLYGY